MMELFLFFFNIFFGERSFRAYHLVPTPMPAPQQRRLRRVRVVGTFGKKRPGTEQNSDVGFQSFSFFVPTVHPFLRSPSSCCSPSSEPRDPPHLQNGRRSLDVHRGREKRGWQRSKQQKKSKLLLLFAFPSLPSFRLLSSSSSSSL